MSIKTSTFSLQHIFWDYTVLDFLLLINNSSIYLEVLDAITLTQGDLEDFYRGYVGGQARQALLPTAPDPNQ